MKTGKEKQLFPLVNYSFFIIISVIMIYPFWYVLMFSISDPNVPVFNSYYLLPAGKPSLATYEALLRQPMLLKSLGNTVFITLVGTFVKLLFTSLTAYPLSRSNLPGRSVIFSLIVFTMIFEGGIIPTYLVVKTFGLINSLWSLILPGAVVVYYLMIMAKFFRGIPESLVESAKIDGYNDIHIFFRLIIPLSKAVYGAIGLFCAVQLWNTYFNGVLFINDIDKRVLQVTVRSLLMEEAMTGDAGMGKVVTTQQNMKMATIIFTMLPILAVYPFLQKYFVKGILIGSVKG